MGNNIFPKLVTTTFYVSVKNSNVAFFYKLIAALYIVSH
jgi:hypothetical protein